VEHAVREPAPILSDPLISHLDQLVGLPSSPGNTEDLLAAATRVAARMRNSGLHVDTLTTPGAPILVGRRAGRSSFTLLLYHHYDVAPPGAWRSWHHDPFQIAEREQWLYGRGVAAGKGPLIAHLQALTSILESDGDLPCSVIVVAEGEGLAGSPHIAKTLADNRELLRADAVLGTGGDRDIHGRPCCYAGTKGLLQLRLRAHGTEMPLPAGYATSVPNPLWRLLWALTQIKSDQEEILINGFYDTIDGPGRGESKALRAVAFDEEARRVAWGLPQFLFAMSNAAIVQAESTLPTCNITSISSDPASDVALIPTSASARLDFQLVPRQHPQAICDLLIRHLADKGLADIHVERLAGGYPGAVTAIDDRFVVQVSEIGKVLHGEPLTILPRGPFIQPLAFFSQAFGIPTATVALARPDSAIFAANERIPVADLLNHGQLLIELMQACANQ
jgi:acetylornithine deacetylase/succinyl-diaminopimelate desuccinylase-like protein